MPHNARAALRRYCYYRYALALKAAGQRDSRLITSKSIRKVAAAAILSRLRSFGVQRLDTVFDRTRAAERISARNLEFLLLPIRPRCPGIKLPFADARSKRLASTDSEEEGGEGRGDVRASSSAGKGGFCAG